MKFLIIVVFLLTFIFIFAIHWNPDRGSLVMLEKWSQVFKREEEWPNLNQSIPIQLISAFQYKNHSVVTMMHRNLNYTGHPIYCRYFDHLAHEIPNSAVKSSNYPQTAVQCPKTPGAMFMSLSFKATDYITAMIPLENRDFEEFPHEIGVCVGRLHHETPSQIVEFVRFHQQLAASMFYFLAPKTDGKWSEILEKYVKNGVAEVSTVDQEHRPAFPAFRDHECFFRSEYHSKWMVNADVDERIVLESGMRLPEFVRLQNPNLCELILTSRRIPSASTPNVTISKEDGQVLLLPKLMFQPVKIHPIIAHFSWHHSPKCRILPIPHSGQHPSAVLFFLLREFKTLERHHNVTT